MADPTKVPAIPTVPTSFDEQQRKFLQAIKELIEVRDGVRGNPLDANVTFRDLTGDQNTLLSYDQNGNVVINQIGGSTTIINSGGRTTIDYTTPPAVTGLTVTGSYSLIIISWTDATYSNPAYAEIWRSNDDVIGHAALIGKSDNFIYVDECGANKSYYYWIRFVSTANVEGPYNAVSGTLGTTTAFVITADQFQIAATATSPTGGANSPFFYIATATVINGVSIPSGAYMKAAYILDASITNAKIGNLAVDNAKIADLAVSDAKIANLSVSKLLAGTIASTEYITVGTGGNRVIIDGLGNIRMGATGYMSGSGVWFGSYAGSGVAMIGNAQTNYIAFDGTNININTPQFTLSSGNAIFSGALQAATGSFSGSLNAATGTFSGALQGATGSFAGALNAATGSFGGSLLAGVIDYSSFQGVNYQYTTVGTYTVTVPADKTTLRVSLIGASGGSGGSSAFSGNVGENLGGAGGGGGGSGVSVTTISGLTAGETITIVVGSHGVGGNGYPYGGGSGSNGSAGGNTTVSRTSGVIAIATGGGGGAAASHTGGAGGAAGTGGGAGGNGGTYFGNNTPANGAGGSGLRVGGSCVFKTANSGRGYGAGTNGQDGQAIIEFFNPNAVVLRTDYNTLISALQRQNIATT